MSFQPARNAFALTYGRTGETRRDMDGLVRKHMPLVRRLAWHVHGSMSTLIDVEDLVQIGLVALVEAAASFEARDVFIGKPLRRFGDA